MFSLNGLVVIVSDSRMVDCLFNTHLYKKKGRFLSSAPRPLFEKVLSFRRLVNGRFFSRGKVVWLLYIYILSTSIPLYNFIWK